MKREWENSAIEWKGRKERERERERKQKDQLVCERCLVQFWLTTKKGFKFKHVHSNVVKYILASFNNVW